MGEVMGGDPGYSHHQETITNNCAVNKIKQTALSLCLFLLVFARNNSHELSTMQSQKFNRTTDT